jgi:hypothetical protein
MLRDDDDDDDNNNNNNNNNYYHHHYYNDDDYDDDDDTAKEQYIKKDTIECVHNYTSTYVRKQGYNRTKNTGTNMSQN